MKMPHVKIHYPSDVAEACAGLPDAVSDYVARHANRFINPPGSPSPGGGITTVMMSVSDITEKIMPLDDRSRHGGRRLSFVEILQHNSFSRIDGIHEGWVGAWYFGSEWSCLVVVDMLQEWVPEKYKAMLSNLREEMGVGTGNGLGYIWNVIFTDEEGDVSVRTNWTKEGAVARALEQVRYEYSEDYGHEPAENDIYLIAAKCEEVMIKAGVLGKAGTTEISKASWVSIRRTELGD